jgi:hypothetical protein
MHNMAMYRILSALFFAAQFIALQVWSQYSQYQVGYPTNYTTIPYQYSGQYTGQYAAQYPTQNTGATQNMWGSGYYSGQQNCNIQTQNQMQGLNQMGGQGQSSRPNRPPSESPTAKLKSQLKAKQSARKRAESKGDLLRKRIERYLDSSVVEFILDTHVEGNQMCDRYKNAHPECGAAGAMVTVAAPMDASLSPDSGQRRDPPPDGFGGRRPPRHSSDTAESGPPPAIPTLVPGVARTQTVECSSLTDVPDLLVNKWTGPNGYCVGNSRSNAGSVKPSICADESLRSSERHSVNVSECSRAIADYRKNRIQLANAADAEEKIQDEIDDAKYADQEGPREPSDRDTEGGCEECARASRGYSYQSNQRDWTSTLTQVAGGIGLLVYGKQAEKSANEYNAQAGFPATQSYGYPYYQAGIYGIINGLTGQSSGQSTFGCTPTSASAAGAFSYPQSYYTNSANYNYSTYSSLPSNSIYNSQYQAMLFQQNVQNINAGYNANGLYNNYQYSNIGTVPVTSGR